MVARYGSVTDGREGLHSVVMKKHMALCPAKESAERWLVHCAVAPFRFILLPEICCFAMMHITLGVGGGKREHIFYKL